jgi:hypothetical protein
MKLPDTAHTPGPWTAHGWTLYADARPLALAYSDYCTDVIQDDDHRDLNERSEVDEKTAYANATLMASAPDLLAALEALTPLAHDMHISHQMGKFDSWAIDAAEAAIAKARGLEPGAIDPACHCAECGAFDKADAVLIEWEGEPRCPDCRPENAAPGGNSMKRTYGFRDIVKLFVDDSKNDPTLKRDTIIVGLLLLGMIITGVLGV